MKVSTITFAFIILPGKGAEYCDQFVFLSVYVSVCQRADLWNRSTYLREIFYADPLWLWLGSPLAAL